MRPRTHADSNLAANCRAYPYVNPCSDSHACTHCHGDASAHPNSGAHGYADTGAYCHA